MGFECIIWLHILSLVLAFPSHTERFPDAALTPRAACTPVAGGSSSIDDAPAIMTAIKSCGSAGTIVLPAGKTYYANSVVDFAGCANCDFQLEGTLKFSSSTSYWGGKTAMISVSKIAGLKFRSLTGNGVIDGNGQDASVAFAPARRS